MSTRITKEELDGIEIEAQHLLELNANQGFTGKHHVLIDPEFALEWIEEHRRLQEMQKSLDDLTALYAIVHAQRDKVSAENKELKAKLDYYFNARNRNIELSVPQIK